MAVRSSPQPGHAHALPPRYRNLILKGGGIRGIAYGGALQELESRGVLAGIERVGGTSAGAIQAALLALGYFRDLYTTGTNLTRQRTQVFSYETHPDMRMADAVRISMSIPLYFRAGLLDADDHVITGKPRPGQPVQVHVDGGLLANYPLHLFDQPRYLPAGLPPGTTANPETLGLRLDRDEQIALDTLATGRPWPRMPSTTFRPTSGRSTRWRSKTSAPPSPPTGRALSALAPWASGRRCNAFRRRRRRNSWPAAGRACRRFPPRAARSSSFVAGG